MPGLISLIAANKNLQYINPGTGEALSFGDLVFSPGKLNDTEKKMAFLYLDNSIHSVAAFWNFFKSKHAVALLSHNLKPEFRQSLESLYRPYFIYDRKRNEIENYSVEKINSALEIFICRKDDEQKISEELKLLLNTSGTTGSPKFVKISEKNLVNNAQSILGYLPVNASDVTPLNLPVHYSYGLSVLITNSLAGGKILCTTHDILQKDFWSDFEKYQCTNLAGVPYVYETLYRTGFTKKMFPFLKYMTVAGGKLNESLVDVFYDFSKKNQTRFYIMYGQTEATARMAYLDPQFLSEKKMSIGKPIVNGRFEIDRETNELLYYGENVFGGYANSRNDLEKFSVEQPLRTGDIASIDNEGFYYITGRLKRIVKLFGNRINLDEIEKSLNEHFRDSSFICTGVDDKILLIGVKNYSSVEKDISQFLFAHYSIHPSVITVKQLSQIPLTENKKINYSKFIEQYGN
jgi:long-subunit acyl-CoA synthetase (AMP-forming)